MPHNEALIAELEHEAKPTRKMLERISVDTWEYKPHEKSMDMKRLALLVAQMFGWVPKMIRYPELDFQNAEKWASDANTTEELVKILDDSLADAKEQLANASDDVMNETWVLRNGDQILWEAPRHETIRGTISHMSHHRGQLSVYMRLNELPVPAIYGPSADDSSFDM